MADVAGTTPGTPAGQATAPASGTPASTPATDPGQSDAGNDPFGFGDAPAGQSGQGAAAPAQPPADQGGTPPANQPHPNGQADPSTKNYLADDFGNDPAKLNKAYANLVPKLTQTSQNYSQVLQIFKKLDEVAGPEIRKILIEKGLVEPTPEERAAIGQPAGVQPPPNAAPPQNPADKPMTRAEMEKFLADKEAGQVKFDGMIADFKTTNPGWEDFKPEIGSILQEKPWVADKIMEGSMNMGDLLVMARGMAMPRVLKTTQEQSLKTGLDGNKARKNAHLETPSQGTTGGTDFDPFDFGKN